MDLRRLTELFETNRKTGHGGIASVCSAHPLVIGATLALAGERNQPALIEATCNQVNQFGGYTGLEPADFAAMVRKEAESVGLGEDDLLLGGDHLGPQPWRSEPAEEALGKARDLVRAFAAAGFQKLHLDCSMRCADDPDVLPDALIAGRAASLASAAEETGARPLYVIGTEVPPPGGMGAGHHIAVTSPASVKDTYETHHEAFATVGLKDAFSRVVAVVVQPGLDFGNEEIVHFAPDKADLLAEAVQDYPGIVFEAHSTDYQLPAAYRELVARHFAILKVGPAATFAMREAFYALEAMEAELVPSGERSRLRAMVEASMLMRPADWQAHYHGDADKQAYLRHFSYSDRIRYYWAAPEIEAARERLFANLVRTGLPLPLISQYLPQHLGAVAEGRLEATPGALVGANVVRALAPYFDAAASH